MPDDGGRSADTGRRRKRSIADLRRERAAVEDPAVVLAAAARFLESRARSRQEVRVRLVQQGYRPDLVEAAVARLVDLGFLDDEQFAHAWVESRDRSRPRGGRVLRLELTRKGVEGTTVEEVMAERDAPASDDTPLAWGARRLARESAMPADEAAARRLLARSEAALLRVADPRKRRQRAYALLARNGFDAGLIGDLVRSVEREWGAAAVDDVPGET